MMRSFSTRTFTDTVLEHRRKPLSTLASFIRLIRHNVPVECADELCDDAHKTAFEWRHRVLATVSGYQDRIVLRDTVWVDESAVAQRKIVDEQRPGRYPAVHGLPHARQDGFLWPQMTTTGFLRTSMATQMQSFWRDRLRLRACP